VAATDGSSASFKRTSAVVTDTNFGPFSHHHHHGLHHHHHHSDKGPSLGPQQNGGPLALKAGGATPVIGIPHHHHRHHHHHHGKPGAHPSTAAAAAAAVVAAPKVEPESAEIPVPHEPTMEVRNRLVFDTVAARPRLHLGDVQYEVTLEPDSLVPTLPNNRGFKSRPKPLPQDRLKGRENCTLTVKISRTHLQSVAREEITARGFLWGTGIHTDDSDVIAACIHGGWIRGEWADDVDVVDLELDQGFAMKADTVQAQRLRDARNSPATQQARKKANEASQHVFPPDTGPVPIQPNRDLHVTILILPRLKEYLGTTLFGITSRNWGGDVTVPHDGISFAVQSVRWADGAGLQSRLRGAARRERLNRDLRIQGRLSGGVLKTAGRGGKNDETWVRINGVLTNKENEGDGKDGDAGGADHQAQTDVVVIEEE